MVEPVFDHPFQQFRIGKTSAFNTLYSGQGIGIVFQERYTAEAAEGRIKPLLSIIRQGGMDIALYQVGQQQQEGEQDEQAFRHSVLENSFRV